MQIALETHPDNAGPAMSVSAFVLLGCLQTIVAYLVFQRTDDHVYFLDIANHGSNAVTALGNENYDLKAEIAAQAFYILATPSRWLGGHELTHLLWLRALTLGGFVCAHRWVCGILAPWDPISAVQHSQRRFMILCLLYPAQLAWTASLLRDGASCAALFAALLSFSTRRWLLAAVCVAFSLALRPEFAVVIGLLMLTRPLARVLGGIRNRLFVMLAIVVAVSLAAFAPRAASSAFAVYAFGDEGVAYPSIDHLLDVKGYLLVLLQSMIDPISIGSVELGLFPVAETVFFTILTIAVLRRLNRTTALVAALSIVDITAMWLFGYFEIFVSGFSRHRIALVIILIAVMAVLKIPRFVAYERAKS